MFLKMPTNSKKILKEKKQANLEVVKPIKTKPYNDIDLNNWKLYENVKTGTWWEFQSREKKNGHSYDYHGNYIPQIATQLFERYTKKGDVVLDLFFGSGTSGIDRINTAPSVGFPCYTAEAGATGYYLRRFQYFCRSIRTYRFSAKNSSDQCQHRAPVNLSGAPAGQRT